MNFRYLLLAVSLVLVPFVVPQDDLELRVEVLEVDIVEIKDDIEDVESSVVQNTGQLFEVINDVDDIDELNVAQDQRIGAVEAENSLLRMRLDQLEQILTSTTQQVEALNETVSYNDNSTNERLAAVESDVTVLGNDVTVLESDVIVLEELSEITDQRLTDLEETVVDYSYTAFLASHSAFTFTPSNPIVLDTAILNSGGHYNPETGIYTVPVDGIYQFVFHYRNSEDNDSGVWLEVDGVQVAYRENYDPDFTFPSADLVLLQSLTVGQQVWIRPEGIGGMYGTSSTGPIFSWFSGHLIYAL